MKGEKDNELLSIALGDALDNLRETICVVEQLFYLGCALKYNSENTSISTAWLHHSSHATLPSDLPSLELVEEIPVSVTGSSVNNAGLVT